LFVIIATANVDDAIWYLKLVMGRRRT